jgi:hypothetical protein
VRLGGDLCASAGSSGLHVDLRDGGCVVRGGARPAGDTDQLPVRVFPERDAAMKLVTVALAG